MRPEFIFQKRHQRLYQVRAPSTFLNRYRDYEALGPPAYHPQRTRPCYMSPSTLRIIYSTCRCDVTRTHGSKRKLKLNVICVVPRCTVPCSLPVQIQRLLVPWVRRARCGGIGAVEGQLFPGEHHHWGHRDSQDHGCRWNRVYPELVRRCCDHPLR